MWSNTDLYYVSVKTLKEGKSVNKNAKSSEIFLSR